MVKEIRYTTIKRVLDNLLDHPLLSDVNLEQAVRYVIRFISLHGYPKLYQDKIENIEIHDFRGELPCDLISIIQVKDLHSHICLRSMTDNFTPGMREHRHPRHAEPRERERVQNRIGMDDKTGPWYIPHALKYHHEPAFKTQGRIIYTSFPEGVVEIAYKSIPVDGDGYPLLIDNENYLAALEAYIKKQVFTVKFDTGKITQNVLQNAQQEYAWLAKQLESEFTVPSTSEMESITRMINTMIPKVREFDDGFESLGDREYLRKH